MFVLTAEEAASLRSQFATSNRGRGGRRTRPRAFTEHGAVMIANVLKSRVAVDASVQVVRAFVQLRELALTHTDLGRRLDYLERDYDSQFKVVFQAIRELMTPPPVKPRPRIGFQPSGEDR
jgi:hypothetical protein